MLGSSVAQDGRLEKRQRLPLVVRMAEEDSRVGSIVILFCSCYCVSVIIYDKK